MFSRAVRGARTHTHRHRETHRHNRVSLGAVHDLICKALGDRLDVTEGALTGTNTDEIDGLVDAAQWRHINSLTTDNTFGCSTRQSQ